ncbi:hypothetical protein ThvES_00019020 [Thiovulum sp. ES]|nr:hypothetical protein ThvES_00019020 [Thiovulum sp. ES]
MLLKKKRYLIIFSFSLLFLFILLIYKVNIKNDILNNVVIDTETNKAIIIKNTIFRTNDDTNISNKIEIDVGIDQYETMRQSIFKDFSVFGVDFSDFNLTRQKVEGEAYIEKELDLFDITNEFKEPLKIFIMKRKNSNFLEGFIVYKFKENKYELISATNLRKLKYIEFPNITPEIAEQQIRKKFNISNGEILNFESKLFHIDKISYPVYKFISDKNHYLVNANDGYVHSVNFIDKFIEAQTQQKRKQEAEKIPYSFSKIGEVIFDFDSVDREFYSEDDIKEMRKEVEEINQAIRDGLLKLDENLNTIYDRRD